MKMGLIKFVFTFISLGLVLSFYPAQEANATSNDECAIWLCLPTGFPSGCSDAKSAMMKRIKHFKSPLPSLSSCLTDASAEGVDTSSTGEMTYDYGYAAHIPTYTYCSAKRRVAKDTYECREETTVEEHYVKGTQCGYKRVDKETTTKYPSNCDATYRYIDEYVDGVQYGDTYYFTTSY